MKKHLVQTLISKDVFDKMVALADEEGLSIAAYVRRLILLDVKKRKVGGSVK